MSINPDKVYKKSNHHRRDNSGELDVFEATRYYAGGINDSFGTHHSNSNNASLSQKMIREERQGHWSRGGRVSVDMPTTMRHQLAHHHEPREKKQSKEKKHKQPSSPGGRLASFLNSLFSQSASKKKKSSSKSSSQSAKDNTAIEEESPGSRRKRRSSISHFRTPTTTTTSNLVDSRSLYSSSSSGFRTPPPYVNTPTKSYKDFRSYSDHKQVLATLSKYNINGENAKSATIMQSNDKRGTNFDWLDEKFKCCNGLLEKPKDLNYGHSEEKGTKKKFGEADHHDDHDAGGESDSSSDLFELQLNYELGYYSSGLPVYETTHVESIKRSGTAITMGPSKIN
ncbi:hypothetical protein Ancab_020902 [Ancistrocladus abbreviatus]